jgi:hypothetical protein
MAEEIPQPQPTSGGHRGGGGAAWIVSLLLVVVLAVVLWFVFAREPDSGVDIDVDLNLPTTTGR